MREILIKVEESGACSITDSIGGEVVLQLQFPEVPQRFRSLIEINDEEIKKSKSAKS